MLTKLDLKNIDGLLDKRFKKELKPLKIDITKIKKDTDEIISFFDREFLGLQRRTVRIEDHLNLPPLQPFV